MRGWPDEVAKTWKRRSAKGMLTRQAEAPLPPAPISTLLPPPLHLQMGKKKHASGKSRKGKVEEADDDAFVHDEVDDCARLLSPPMPPLALGLLFDSFIFKIKRYFIIESPFKPH